MFMDYHVKDNQLIITVDLEEKELLGLKKSSTGKSYNVYSDRIVFDFKGYPIKGNLNLYILKDDYEEIMSVKKLATISNTDSNNTDSNNTDSNNTDSNVETRIDKLEDAVSQLTNGLNQLITLLNSNSNK